MDRKESRRISTFPAFNRHFISNGPPRKAFVMLQQYLVPDRKITDVRETSLEGTGGGGVAMHGKERVVYPVIAK